MMEPRVDGFAMCRSMVPSFDIVGELAKEQSNELYDMVRKFQPGCLINSRIGCGDTRIFASWS